MRNLLLLTLLLALAMSASGSEIIIGGVNGNNVFPFSWYDGNGRYQQFYSGMPQGFEIWNIAFRSLNEEYFSSQPYDLNVTMGLGTATSQTSNFGTNLGSDYRIVYNSTLTFVPGAERDIDGFDLRFNFTNPFIVTSSDQTLVLDVMINANVDAFIAFAAGWEDPRSSRLYQSGGSGPTWQDELSLQTKFSDVPEPATWALMGAGLVGLAVYRRRK